MTALHWLMTANAALWLGLGAYLAFIARAQKALEQRVRQMEMEHDE